MSDGIFRRVLGNKFNLMPATVRTMHSLQSRKIVNGEAKVIEGRNILSRLIRKIACLPPPSHRVPITILFTMIGQDELWERHFGKNLFSTTLKNEHDYVVEYMKPLPVSFVYQLVPDARGFFLKLVKTRVFGVNLPKILSPILLSRTDEWRGRYRFCSRVGFWFCGWVITYTGYLNAPSDIQNKQSILIP